MTDEPVVSVVLPTLNEAEHISGAVDSILSQTLNNFELIVVDGGSSDDTLDIVKAKDDDRITLIEQTESRGIAAALNRGIEASTAPYVARMDADDRSRPTRLERQINAFSKRDPLVLVSSWSRVIGKEGEYLTTVKTKMPDEPVLEVLRQQGQFVWHGSLMFRRDVLNELGGYRPAFDLAEDYDLLLRIFEQYDDEQFYIVPEVLYDYRISPRQKIKRKPQEAVSEFARKASVKRQSGESESRQVEAAKRARKQIKTSDPTETELERMYHEMFGNYHLREGRTDSARREFRHALQKDPTSFQAWKGVVFCSLPHRLRSSVQATAERLWWTYRRIISKIRARGVE